LNVCFQLNKNTNFEVESEKWALAIESISSISVSKKNRKLLRMQIDRNLNNKIIVQNKLQLKKNKSEREFIFYYEKDLKKFLFQIRRIYTNLKNSFLIINLSN
jgi:hypothetical protein